MKRDPFSQVNDFRFGQVVDSDPGAIARNVEHHQVAIERAQQRNGGQNIPSSPPQSVTAADVTASRAVSTPVRQMTDARQDPYHTSDENIGTEIAEGNVGGVAKSIGSGVGSVVGGVAGLAVGEPGAGASAGSAAGESVGGIVSEATQKGDDENFNEKKKREAEAVGAVEPVGGIDALSWGRSGQVESNPEHGAPRVPEAVAAASGVYAQTSQSTSVNPSTLGKTVLPDSPHGARGNWNMSQISAYEVK